MLDEELIRTNKKQRESWERDLNQSNIAKALFREKYPREENEPIDRYLARLAYNGLLERIRNA